MLIHPHDFVGSVEDKEAHLRFFISVCAYAYEELDETLIPDPDFDHLCFEVKPEQSTGIAELDAFFRSHWFDPSTGRWVVNLPAELLEPVKAAAAEWVAELPRKVTDAAMTDEQAAEVGQMIGLLRGTKLTMNNLCQIDTGIWRANVRSRFYNGINKWYHEYGEGPTPWHAIRDCFDKAGLKIEETP
jgi:hypothetical protein